MKTSFAFHTWASVRRIALAKLSGPLAQNTIWALAGYGLRLIIQAVYFVVIARCLGPKEYGGFIAVTAMANMIAPFVSLGTGSLMIRNVSRDKTRFSESWGNCLVVTITSGLSLLLLTVALGVIWLPSSISFVAILLICTADLVFVRLLDVAVWAFQAFERMAMTARLNVLISVTRLCGVVGLVAVVRKPTVLAWATVYLAAAIVSAACALAWVHKELGKPAPNFKKIFSESKEGLLFAVSNSAATIYNDIDKTMVARLSTLDATGIYGSAYRIIDVAFIPIRALLNAAYPGFFRKGGEGLHSALRYGRRLFLKTLPFALLTVTGLYLGAPIVPHILGRSYSNVTEALYWLCPIPLFKTFQFFIADALTGAGYQRIRTAGQVCVAIVNIAINVWAIPLYGWRGAAWSSLISDGLLALVLWLVAYQLSRNVPEATGSVEFVERAHVRQQA
jgi:O-antigen/teichoic acid export membrane protein